MNSPTQTRREFQTRLAGGLVLIGLTQKSAKFDYTPDMGVALWMKNMISYGHKHGKYLASAKPNDPIDPLLDATFYDAQRVYYNIADYTGDHIWETYANAAMHIYRDRYAMYHKGGVPGYWIFTRGIAMNYQRTKDPESLKAVKTISKAAAFAAEATPASFTVGADMSREVAYVIEAKIDAELLGEPRTPRLPLLVDQALNHLDQWFGSKKAKHMQSFMVALTAEALIRWNDLKPDPRVLPALQTAAAGLWNQMWDPKGQAFKYFNVEVPGKGGPTPAPDLNLLIAPFYAWLYHQTGHLAYRDRAIATFVGGVKKSYMERGKQFNQNYRWSFDYLKWVTAKPLA